MSERKVLNKYYPPDFDPSKIPKCKEPRNKTFCIRLMAPCNMRCTTCGEYIYKVRIFLYHVFMYTGPVHYSSITYTLIDLVTWG
jgi:hypothetical protein